VFKRGVSSANLGKQQKLTSHLNFPRRRADTVAMIIRLFYAATSMVAAAETATGFFKAVGQPVLREQ